MRISHLYILKGDNPVGEPDVMKWARWMENHEQRRVAREKVGDCEVSTVFLGTDHGNGVGAPILWETMVFGGKHDQEWMYRCSGSREQAEAMHQKMVRRVKRNE